MAVVTTYSGDPLVWFATEAGGNHQLSLPFSGKYPLFSLITRSLELYETVMLAGNCEFDSVQLVLVVNFAIHPMYILNSYQSRES